MSLSWELPHISVDDLHKDSSRLDIATAAPSEDVLYIQFTITAVINAIVALSSFLLLASILASRKVRKQAFNCYILAITFPDFFMTSMCVVTCALSASVRSYYSEAMWCVLQYILFASAGSCFAICSSLCTLPM